MKTPRGSFAWLLGRRRTAAGVHSVVGAVDPFATVGDFNDLEDELRRVLAHPERRLFPGGPSGWLIGLGSVTVNPWFVEPSLRAGYIKRCNAHRDRRSRALPVPLGLEAARRVAWSFVTVFADGWPDGVLERHDQLGPVAYCQHSSLMLELHSLSVDELVEFRSRPGRSGWAFALDPDYPQLYSIPMMKGNK